MDKLIVQGKELYVRYPHLTRKHRLVTCADGTLVICNNRFDADDLIQLLGLEELAEPERWGNKWCLELEVETYTG